MRLVLYMLLICFNLFAQEKKKLSVNDYQLWSNFNQTKMSNDGNWVCFGVENEKADTLFLHSPRSGSYFTFLNGKNSSFSPNNKWLGYFQNDSLKLFDLNKKIIKFIGKTVSDYHFSHDGTFLLVFTQKNSFKTLELLNINKEQSIYIENVVSYQLSPDSKRIALIINDGNFQKVKVISFNNFLNEQEIVSDSNCEYKNLKWNNLGDKLSFFKEIKNNLVLYWSTGFDKKVSYKTLDTLNSSFPEKSELATVNLYLPEKGNKVFFTIKKVFLSSTSSEENDNVQIWKSSDLTIPPKKFKDSKSDVLLWQLWDVELNAVYNVEDEEHNHSIVTNDFEHALVYQPEELAPVYKCSNEFITLYVKNLATGKKIKLSEKQALLQNRVVVSTTGKYIAYFTDKEWWIYDVRKDKHRCVSKGISGLHKLDYDEGGLVPPVYKPTWSQNDTYFIFYDQNDVWKVKSDGSFKKRLTNGVVNNLIYRLHESKSPKSPNFYSYGFLSNSHNLDKPLLLKTENSDDYSQGFSMLYPDGTIKVLIERNSKFDLINKSVDGSAFLILEQSFDISPRLIHISLEGKESIVYKTNKQQQLFEWGKSKLVNYTNTKGKKLKGALFYPENYDVKKQYPLLVVIYEKKSNEIFDYSFPSLSSNWGFTLINYVTDDYFVLFPDITYNMDSPGDAALDCVSSAVEKVLESYPVNKNAIGLFGHSFGGYEAAYIIGKSKMFKAAVIGSPVIDLQSTYLTLDGHGISNMWRFEYDQMRIKAPFYSDDFKKNSPLENVTNISSPLLIWTGSNDLQLDWKNSMKLHTALWKLGKKSNLLVYSNEGHVFSKKENKNDLTVKVKEWLDYYLIGGEKSFWIE